MGTKFLILVFSFLFSSVDAQCQYLSRNDLESLDSCYYCVEWRKEFIYNKDSILIVTFYDENDQDRRKQYFDNSGVCIFLYQKDAEGNGAGLSYRLGPKYSTIYYNFNGEGSGIGLSFSDDHKLIEMTFTNMYGALNSLIAFDSRQRITRKAELSDSDPYLWHYWVYDKKGRIREEGFTYNQAKFGEWKFYNRKGRMIKTKDLGPRPKP